MTGEAVRTISLDPELQISDKLKLRLLVPEDSEAMFRIMQADPNIHSYITWAAGKETEEDVRGAIEGFQRHREPRYALLEDEKIIGYIGLFRSPDIEDEYEFGYFCDPSRRGNGFMSAATTELMRVATDHLGAKSFSLYIQDQNKESRAVALRLGFTHTNVLREDEILQRMERRYEKLAEL